MKYLVLVGDGMGDYPVDLLGGKSPLEAAAIPGMRAIAASGVLHSLKTVPAGLPPGSDVCNMGLLGYNALEKYTGRAPIEAVGAGIPLKEGDVAFRCNLVTVQDGTMIDYSAGHITTEEGDALIRAVAAELETDQLTFYPGISYRHLIVWHRGPQKIATEPPHEIADQAIGAHLPSGERSEEVCDLMERSKAILAEHPVNRARQAAGQNTATQLWLWGQGSALTLPSYQERFGLSGGVVTAVDLVRGLGRLAGLATPEVEGATGFIDTNYAGKVDAAKDILAEHPFAYVHIEAPDECGHMGDAKLKTGAIEAFDREVVLPLWKHMESLGEPYRLLLAMDHRTPVSLRGHTDDPVPFAVLEGPVGSQAYETSAPFDETILTSLPESWSYALIQDLLSPASRS